MGKIRRHWLSATAPDFLINQFVSTVGAMVVGTLAAVIPAFLIAAVTKNNSGGNWADHVAAQRILRAAGEPYFLLPILAGFLLGALSYRYSRSATALWVSSPRKKASDQQPSCWRICCKLSSIVPLTSITTASAGSSSVASWLASMPSFM